MYASSYNICIILTTVKSYNELVIGIILDISIKSLTGKNYR